MVMPIEWHHLIAHIYLRARTIRIAKLLSDLTVILYRFSLRRLATVGANFIHPWGCCSLVGVVEIAAVILSM